LAGSALLVALAACNSALPQATPTPTATSPQPDRDHLAGLAAAAEGDAYVATYKLSVSGRPDRTVTVAIGTDGSWVVAIPASGLSGLADLAMFQSKDGEFQCLLGPADGTEGSRPDLGSLNPGCAKVSTLTPANDPRVQHIFTDWLAALTDRSTALSVTQIPTPSGATGTCFSVESTSAALAPPVDPGTYCYDQDGVLTMAAVGFGTLHLVAPVAAAPPSVAMPAPVVNRTPIAMVAPSPPPPPPPSPTPSASATPRT
jgi:hypothetical protein